MAGAKLVRLNPSFKNELDNLFLNSSHVDSEKVKKTMSDDWYEHEEYSDVMEYMMVNGGMPGENGDGYVYRGEGSVYYDDTHINTEVVDSILKFYTEEDGANKTLEEFAYYLYRDENIRKGLKEHFENVRWWCKVKEISTRELKKEKGVRYNRPRMYAVLETDITFVQPDRRKPIYYLSSGHGLVLDERTIVDFDWK